MQTSPLSITLAGLELTNPTMLASGIMGYTAESFLQVAKGGAGAIVTKSIGTQPRAGYANPIVVQTKAGLLNAVGLPNPGIDIFAEEIKYTKTLLHIPLIVSIFGYSAEDYATAAKKATEAGADAVELNVSCPHVKQTGAEIGQSPKLLAEVVQQVKAVINKPLIVKLSPNVTDIGVLAQTAVEAGADALTAVNTLRALAIDSETQLPILSNIKGGMSGPAIKPVALRCVYDLAQIVEVPIIGCGGITNWQDAVEFFLAGASAVQIGTAVADNMEVFSSITKGVETYLRQKHYGSIKEIIGLAHRK
ncbi:dihydroorotate dehydrogenase [Candidatus Bathycorpusculum sp.]|uniref:dihydroorotate dehydrogenase n=1 Tax=Candidatus Bathycorpusculum sp. TaxID=2994959 RepID=UPI00283798C8|nr:dihydroorotate dehydrogenase [Candidatus Termitimicrobium sp.]MCL2684923.1 dihydroorotate dehydrogenase [Candidatus Termitimicrobium sp.]